MNKVLSIIGFVVLIASLARSAEVTLSWDPNDPAPDGYKLYQRLKGQAYNDTSPAWTGTDANCTVGNLQPGTVYYFVVRAYVGPEESGDSNEVTHTPEAQPANCVELLNTAGQPVTTIQPGRYFIGASWIADISAVAPAPSIEYHGNAKSKSLHKPDCRYYNCKSCTVIFSTINEAEAAGFQRCRICLKDGL